MHLATCFSNDFVLKIVFAHSHCYQKRSWSVLRLSLLSLVDQEEWERSYRNCWRKEQRRKRVGYGLLKLSHCYTICLPISSMYMYVPSIQLFDWWNQVAYLGFRLPVVVHSSPGIGFPLMQAKDVDQLTRYVWLTRNR